MSHRRPSRPTPSPASRRAPSEARKGPPSTRCRTHSEPLERRRLLTTVTDFGGGPGQLVFTDGEGNPAVIYYNDVTFEVVGAHRETTTAAPFLSDLQRYPLPVTTPVSTGTDPFKFYVTESAADSFIAVTEYTPLVAPGPPYTLTPYSGSVGAVGVNNAAGVPTTDLPSVGGILIGGVMLGPSLTATPRPDLTDTLSYPTQIGLQPIEAGGTLSAGIQVLPTDPATGLQNDFGNFVVGGDVTGTVSFGGNLNEFYAGGIYTGLSSGGTLLGTANLMGPTGVSASPDPGNFSVAGDLREFLSAGTVGTDGAILPALYGNANNDPAFYNYVSNFDLEVGGTLGEMHLGNVAAGFTGATFAGTINVAHSDTVSGQVTPTAGEVVGSTAVTREVEDVSLTAASPAIDGQAGLINTPANQFADAQVDFTNDSLADAQILGSFPQTDAATGTLLRDASGHELTEASVDGQVAIIGGDGVDYYGVAMMGGSTFTVNLTDVSVPGRTLGLSIYDPDGRLIETNAEANDAQAIQVKADRPGIYKFAVSSGVTTAYNLTVLGVGDLGIGGIVVNGSFSDTGVDGGVILDAGDIGAINVTGTYYSLTDGPTDLAAAGQAPSYAASSIVVAAGTLRAIVAGALGEVAPGSGTYDDGPVYNIPDGGIGLAQTTTGIMDFETQFDPNYLDLPTPQYVTNDAYAHAISGSVQVIDAATTLYANLFVDGSVGTIRAGNMATATPSQIDVNADNTGNDGIIDLFDVEGQLGTLGGGGPVIRTNTNGNVRYMVCPGPIFLPSSFGATQDQATNYPIAAAETVTDDSGSTIRVTPYGPSTTAVTTTTTVIGSNGTATTTTTAANASSGATVVTPTPGTTVRTVSVAPGQTQYVATDALGNTTTTLVTGPQLSILSYPVSDKGGQIPISISCTGSLTITGAGSNGAASGVDVGTILIAGVGRPLTTAGVDQFGNAIVVQPVPTTASTSPVLTGTPATGTSAVGPNGANTVIKDTSLESAGADDPTDLFLVVNGQATVDVYDVQSAQTINFFDATPGYYGSIPTTTTPTFAVPVVVANRTGGEIVNTDFPNGVGTLQARGNLGFASSEATPAAVYSRPVVENDYPFVQQHTAIVTGGNAVNILSNASIGNVVAATVQNLVADFGNHPAPGVFAGITGPVVASNLNFVQVGQGLTATGTGSVGLSGLFATVKIGEITNGGVPNGDIRGNIVALNVGNTDIPAIDLIQLGNASIIDSTIYDLDYATYVSLDSALTTGDVFSVAADVPSGGAGALPLSLSQPAGNPIAAGNASDADIRAISITGAGGILSATIGGGSIGPITVSRNGFGVLDTLLTANAAGRVFGITAGGYGIRGTTIDNGGFVGLLSATGNGSDLPVTAFPLDLRPSDSGGAAFDANGSPLSALDDLNIALGGSTSAASPSVANVTDTGVVEDVAVEALYDVSGISAQKLRTGLPLNSTNTLPAPSQANIPVIGTPFANSITTGGAVGAIRVRSLIDGFQVTAGSLGQFTQTGDVNRLGIDVAGSISNLTIHGNLGAIITDPATLGAERDSYIYANGQSSSIGKLTVYGNVYADIFSSKYIGSINIHGDLDGNVTIQGVATSNLALTSMTITGSIAAGSLNIAGAVGTITTGGSLGIAGQSLAIAGPVKKLIVGSAHAANAALALNLTVYGTVGTLTVNGQITGNVHILDDLQSLTVNGNAAHPLAVSGNINVDGTLARATINNGNVASTVTAIGGVGTFTINRGSLLGLAAIQSTLGSIGDVRVVGGAAYGIAGSIVAANGQSLNVSDSGSFGDGTDVATILALSGGTVSIGGNVENNAVLSIAGLLDRLTVGGTVQAGGTVSGHPIKTLSVGTPAAGTVVAT